MANQETQIVDEIIVKTRRKMLSVGGAALAGMVMGGLATKANAQTTTIGDTDILNFALNLEYLEANFYYLAAFGTTIDVANANTAAAGLTSAISIKGGATGSGTPGTVMSKTAATCKVPFTNPVNQAYAIETAIEEGKHVNFLATTLGTLAVPQPAIDLRGGTGFDGTAAWNKLYNAAAGSTGATFDPFLSDGQFLLGAYVFEDVGVSAYHGAASLISQGTTGKVYLQAAAGILAVEAYHAGLVRTAINAQDTVPPSLVPVTVLVSKLRASLSMAAGPASAAATAAYDPYPDDYGLAPQTVTVGAASVTATQLTDAPQSNVVAFARNTTQVLNIVTGGGAGTAAAPISPAKGVFFPAGMNGLIK